MRVAVEVDGHCRCPPPPRHVEGDDVAALAIARGIAWGLGVVIVGVGRGVFGLLALSVWAVARLAEVVLAGERALGGSRRQLTRVVYWRQPANHPALTEYSAYDDDTHTTVDAIGESLALPSDLHARRADRARAARMA